MATEKVIDIGAIPVVNSFAATDRLFGYDAKGNARSITRADLLNQVTIREHSQTDSGQWVRLAEVAIPDESYAGILTISGYWHYGPPGAAVIALALPALNVATGLFDAKLLAGTIGAAFGRLRIVKTESRYFIDVQHGQSGRTRIAASFFPMSDKITIYDTLVAATIGADDTVSEIVFGGGEFIVLQ